MGAQVQGAVSPAQDLRGCVREWVQDGRRHLLIRANLRVMPYVRQTKATRWGSGKAAARAQEYNEARAAVRDGVAYLMRQRGVAPFGKVRLGFACSVWLRPKKVWTGKTTSTVDSMASLDLGNLEKALEDAFNGVVYPDDSPIWRRGEGEKVVADEDGFVAHVWEVG